MYSPLGLTLPYVLPQPQSGVPVIFIQPPVVGRQPPKGGSLPELPPLTSESISSQAATAAGLPAGYPFCLHTFQSGRQPYGGMHATPVVCISATSRPDAWY